MSLEDQRRHLEFLVAVDSVWQKAQEILRERGQQYDACRALPDHFLDLPSDCTYQIYSKALRMDSLLAQGKDDECWDSILDIINYAAFFGAHLLSEGVTDEGSDHQSNPAPRRVRDSK